MAADKKKSALAMVFGAHPSDDDAAPAEPAPDDFATACDELMDAIKTNNKAGFCEALKAAIDLHTSAGDEPDGDEEPPQDDEAA